MVKRGGGVLTKRIIPCLDVKEGRVVKGVQFVSLRDAGDPVELAKFYDEQGADELVFLDISASHEGRDTMVDVVRQTAATLAIPFTVGGGIRSLEDMKRILRAGADKVSVNTSALERPALIKEGSDYFGAQCIVVAIDARYSEEDGTWMVYTHGGRNKTSWQVIEWAKEAVRLGAGEILLTSMNQDGEKSGFDLALTKAVRQYRDSPSHCKWWCRECRTFLRSISGRCRCRCSTCSIHFPLQRNECSASKTILT